MEQQSEAAFAHYRHLVEEANREPVAASEEVTWTDAEVTWWQLGAVEAQAFGIDPRLRNALMFAWVRYQDFIGCTDVEFGAFREAERAAFGRYFAGERVASLDLAPGFMSASCGLPFGQCLAWVLRAQVQYLRSGLVQGADDPAPPAWAVSALAGDNQAAGDDADFEDVPF